MFVQTRITWIGWVGSTLSEDVNVEGTMAQRSFFPQEEGYNTINNHNNPFPRVRKLAQDRSPKRTEGQHFTGKAMVSASFFHRFNTYGKPCTKLRRCTSHVPTVASGQPRASCHLTNWRVLGCWIFSELALVEVGDWCVEKSGSMLYMLLVAGWWFHVVSEMRCFVSILTWDDSDADLLVEPRFLVAQAAPRPAAFQAPDRRSCCAMRWRQGQAGQAPGAGTKLSTQSLSSKVWPESIRRCMRTRWWCQSGPANLRNSCESWAVMAIKSWKNRKYCKIIWSDQWAFVASSGHLIYCMFDHVSSSAYPDLIQGGPLWWRMKNQTLDSRVLCSRPVTARPATQSRFWPYVEFGTSRIMFWAVSLFFVIICCMLLFSVSATTRFSHIFFLVLGFLFHASFLQWCRESCREYLRNRHGLEQCQLHP